MGGSVARGISDRTISAAGRLGRRAFVSLLAGAAAWPVAARGQQAMPVVGFLNGQKAADFAHLVTAFRAGLNQGGYVEGRNVAVEYRWAEGQQDRVPALIADLLRRQVAVIAHGGVTPRMVLAATSTVPVVSTFGGDPVRLGFVKSINRPGANITGASIFTADLEAKRLELLCELLPNADRIGVLRDLSFSESETQLREVEAAARTMGRKIHVLAIGNQTEIATAFARLAEMRVAGILVTGGPLFNSQRIRMVALAARFEIPTIQETRESTLAGGLMSYGPSIPDVYHKLGVYSARILKGDLPGDLPVLQPTKFEMAINLSTAKRLGLKVPTSILLRAEEVIE
jgi:putative ABC transport system substrate-binding protein